MLASHASPYTPGRLSLAAGELADADLIVMHCMGYDEAMRATVAEISGRPVLLARRMVAAAVQQRVSPATADLRFAGDRLDFETSWCKTE